MVTEKRPAQGKKRRKKNRLTTDAIREVRATFSRFVSILLLSALAVAFLAGLRTTAPDMEYTADNYYDRSHMMDGYVLSTLGLTDGDLDALAAAPGVEQVEGGWTLDAVAQDAVAVVRDLPASLNLLDLTEGRLPEAADECVTESLMLTKLGLEIGDVVELSLAEDDGDALKRTSFTIVGTAQSPLYVGNDRGSSSLGSGSADGFLYIPAENFDLDYYTVAYLTFDGLAALDSYGDDYEERLDAYLDGLEDLADERAALRYDELVGDAQAELDDARGELDDAKADAEQELADAWQELEDARAELDDGWAEYYDGVDTYDREIADAERELADALDQIEDGERELADGRAQYNDGLAQYQSGLAAYEDSRSTLDAGQAELDAQRAALDEAQAELNAQRDALDAQQAQADAQRAELDAQQAQLDAGYAAYEEALQPYEGTPYYEQAVAEAAEQKAALDAAQTQLDGGYAQLTEAQAQLDGGYAQLAEAQNELDAGYAQLAAAQSELDAGYAQLAAAQSELDAAKATLDSTARQLQAAEQELAEGRRDYEQGRTDLEQARADGQQELDDALRELNDGEAEYADGLQAYEDGRAEADEEIADAEQKLSDAQDELDDVAECEWYVLGRDTNAGFEGYAQDAERVGNLASVFPVIFFLVAGLACLTTMTRMVEDQRTQIGALKALGFSRGAIAKKYIGYAFWASFIGGVLGLLGGCTLIPAVIANAFNIMYHIPTLEFKLQPAVCVLAVLAAVAVTTGAALWATLSTLMDTPANLMRPKSPKAGRRVFLERVTPLWRRLSFTWKVTVRNLFRYQRRFWMTVVGIGGCTALIVTGFGLHDSIFAILDKQFDEISLYDATVGLDSAADAEAYAEVADFLDGSPAVDRWLETCHVTAEASFGDGPARSVNIYAVDDWAAFREFIDLRHRRDNEAVTLPDEGVLITEKLSELLGVEVGDTVTLDRDGRVEAPVVDIVENYVYHNVYMTEDYYAALFGEQAEGNLVMLSYAEGGAQEESDRVSERLMAMDAVESYSYIATLRDTFTNSMNAIDYAVVIIIGAAAALAFVVLYNLTNINITERVRELATLKVLGFSDGETTMYVCRENIFLTFFGIVLGLVLGRFLHAWLVLTVEVDLVMFGRTAPTYAYVLAAVLTVVFAVVVNIAAHFKLKKVDMVESLKTVE